MGFIMFAYNIDELAVIYDTLEFLSNEYNITVSNIPGSKDVTEVKNKINKVIQDLINASKNQAEVKKLNKYILK